MAWERKKRFTKDISSKEGTIGKAFSDHRDELMACKTADELRACVSKVFASNGISTDKSRLIEFKLKSMSYTNALLYVQNILFASMGMGTY